MKKDSYVKFLFIGAFFLFLTLPVCNYIVDKHRVLHHDYEYAYEDVTVNKPFLRVSYLLENKHKYDTITFGSSRSGALDVEKISKNAYRLDYPFGVTGSHLANLKTLLDHNVSMQNVWIGINDYIIWKDSNDHESDHLRKTYKSTLLGKIDFYTFYLFNAFDYKDWNIILGKTSLIKTDGVLQKTLANSKKQSRVIEQSRIKSPARWIKKITGKGGTVLGYQDGKTMYRIDEAVEELSQIKALCDKHNINLKIFMYPMFYKTYLQYNQFKIEEFKRKLVEKVSFHDFYALNSMSLDELSWADTSHFTVTLGDELIKNIQHNDFLVTKKNIDKRIENTRKLIKKVVDKSLPYSNIQRFNPNMDISILKPIFKLKNNTFTVEKNEAFSKEEEKYYSGKNILNGNPELILNHTKATSQSVVLAYRVKSNRKTIFQIFYKKSRESEYNERDSYRVTLRKGMNKINLLISSEFINNTIRIDPVSNVGEYTIEELAIYGS